MVSMTIIKMKGVFMGLQKQSSILSVRQEEGDSKNKTLSMESADKVRMHLIGSTIVWLCQGVGALYIIMDTIRRKREEQREIEEKQKQEEIFNNGVNKGRELLKPL